MDKVCQHCRALKFAGERPGLCCTNGQVRIPDLETPPAPLDALFSGEHIDGRHFLANARIYNQAFAMTSFGAKKIRPKDKQGFESTFKVQGQVSHWAGSLLPDEGATQAFLQIYFMGNPEIEANLRIEYNSALKTKREVVKDIQRSLHANNRYVRQFKAAMDQTANNPDLQVIIKAEKNPPGGQHRGRFNAPTANEVAVVLADQTSAARRDIVLQIRGGGGQRIDEFHRCYDAMQYPLLHAYGEDGYHFKLKRVDPKSGQETSKALSAMDFYAYRLMKRTGKSDHLLRSGHLLSQYMTDQFAKIETERLLYLKSNQADLRADNYANLRDAVMVDGQNPSQLGVKTILPSSFTGGPRYMFERAQDAMRYVQIFGRPHLFITMTANPKWDEITRELSPGQTATQRHDIVARVFRLKVEALKVLLYKVGVFGKRVANAATIEWQKRYSFFNIYGTVNKIADVLVGNIKGDILI